MKAKKVFEEPYAPDYNIAPTTFQPVVRLSIDDEREISLMHWGLVPNFAKSVVDFRGFSMFNARAESLMNSGTWRIPFERRRCLIPADGFYEWKTMTTSREDAIRMRRDGQRPPKLMKVPYAVTLTNSEPMAFAGLWDAWKEPKPKSDSVHTPDKWLQSFSIITTEANEIMSAIYTRMPVILHPRNWEEWLDRDDSRRPPMHLLRPYDSDEMQTVPCNPKVGNVKNNGEEMLVCPAPGTLALNSA